MAINSDLARILDPKYDPANDSPTKFCDSYKLLVEHRNELRERLESKEERRAQIMHTEGQYLRRVSSPKHLELTTPQHPPQPPAWQETNSVSSPTTTAAQPSRLQPSTNIPPALPPLNSTNCPPICAWKRWQRSKVTLRR